MISFNELFPTIPSLLKNKLEKAYREIKLNFSQRKYEPSELNGGKFCEVVLRILEWYTSPTKNYTPFGSTIKDFGQATRRFESMSSFPNSIRFHIPKTLTAIYDIRNKRGVGHTGGDVDPNHMDALYIVSNVDWICSELVRIFHNTTTIEAQKIVEALISRKSSVIWEVDGKKRVLASNLTYGQETLLILYDAYPNPLHVQLLIESTEYKNSTDFRNKVLAQLHIDKLINFNRVTNQVNISPRGLKFVEESLPLEI